MCCAYFMSTYLTRTWILSAFSEVVFMLHDSLRWRKKRFKQQEWFRGLGPVFEQALCSICWYSSICICFLWACCDLVMRCTISLHKLWHFTLWCYNHTRGLTLLIWALNVQYYTITVLHYCPVVTTQHCDHILECLPFLLVLGKLGSAGIPALGYFRCSQ